MMDGLRSQFMIAWKDVYHFKFVIILSLDEKNMARLNIVWQRLKAKIAGPFKQTIKWFDY